jgi:hypothetical protein
MTFQRSTKAQIFNFDPYAGELDAATTQATGNALTVALRPKLSINYPDFSGTIECASPPPGKPTVERAACGKIEVGQDIFTWYAAVFSGQYLANEPIKEGYSQAAVFMLNSAGTTVHKFAGQLYDANFSELLNDAIITANYNSTAQKLAEKNAVFTVLPIDEDKLQHRYEYVVKGSDFTHTMTGDVSELKKAGCYGMLAPKPFKGATAFNVSGHAAILFHSFKGYTVVTKDGHAATAATQVEVLRSITNQIPKI